MPSRRQVRQITFVGFFIVPPLASCGGRRASQQARPGGGCNSIYHRVGYTSKYTDVRYKWRAALARRSRAVQLDEAVQAMLVSLGPRPEEAPEATLLCWCAWRRHCASFRAKSFERRRNPICKGEH